MNAKVSFLYFLYIISVVVIVRVIIPGNIVTMEGDAISDCDHVRLL